MSRLIDAPVPTEEKLLNVIARDISFPNGRVMRVAISEWHWEMVAFVDLWSDHYGREAGILYEFHKRVPATTDTEFSHAVMRILRDDYNEWRDETPTDRPVRFHDPRG